METASTASQLRWEKEDYASSWSGSAARAARKTLKVEYSVYEAWSCFKKPARFVAQQKVLRFDEFKEAVRVVREVAETWLNFA